MVALKELGHRIVDEVSEPGVTPWTQIPANGLLSVQAWAKEWSGASVRLQVSHDGIHASDVGTLSEANSGMLGLPSGVYFRGVVSGIPTDLVVSVVAIESMRR